MAKPDREESRKIAASLVAGLFRQAEDAFPASQEVALRFVRKARRAAERARIPVPAQFRRRFCRYCSSFWVPGRTVRVRLQKQKVVYCCLVCRHYFRLPYVAEKKERRTPLTLLLLFVMAILLR